MTSSTQVRLSTANQDATLRSMLTELATFDAELARSTWSGLAAQRGHLTFEQASQHISTLGDCLRTRRQEARKTQRADLPEIPTGRYAVETDEGHLAFYHVFHGDSGYYSVEVQAGVDLHKLAWPQAKAILVKIEKAGVEEAGLRYGKELGVCGKCGRPLTNEVSRAAGIGPICANRD